MASAAQTLSPQARQQTPWQWFADFLRKELMPYPGRGWTVARMTIAATIVMLCIMVFRMPNAALGAYYTLLFSRDSARATVRSVVRSVTAVGVSLLYVTVTVRLFAGEPFLHFMWVVGTLFITFFLISALTEYLAGTAFGFLAVTSIGAWDFPANTDVLFENTLWTALAVVLGAVVTTVVELVFRSLHPSDEFTDRLLARMQTVEDVLRCLADQRPIDDRPRQRLEQYAMTGTAALRQLLVRSSEPLDERARMSAIVALTGRLIDLLGQNAGNPASFTAEERAGLGHAAQQMGQIRSALQARNPQAIAAMETNTHTLRPQSFLGDVQTTIDRYPEVFSGLQSLPEYLPSEVDVNERRSLFKPDAFTSHTHIRFALKGTLAASSCYFLYNAIQWRGLSSSVPTCMITALSTVGSSRQKQMLRVAGAILGALCFGMTAQVFLLPYLNGIGEFTLLFAAVTAIAGWITTSSPRISYAGAQTGFAFYVTHLRVFGPQTSLTVARDDVMGIMFGLLMMWVTFDRLWSKDSARDMVDQFVSNIRRIADFDQCVKSPDVRSTINRARRERAAINDTFNAIRDVCDSLIFEFGSGWRRKVQLRDHVRLWQPQLRTYFLLLVALLHYRLQSEDRSLEPEAEQNLQRSEQLLTLLADLKDPAQKDKLPDVRQQVDLRVREFERNQLDHAGTASAETQPVRLSRSMLEVAVSLAGEMRHPDTATST